MPDTGPVAIAESQTAEETELEAGAAFQVIEVAPIARQRRGTVDNVGSGTRQKALQLNLDAKTYGTFAEIGAGQEVARWFFSVGGAAGTVAQTISAYDMAVSDALYGPTPRYVSRQRLEAMLEHEFTRLREGLEPGRQTSASSLLPTPWRRAVSANPVPVAAGSASGFKPDRTKNPPRSLFTRTCATRAPHASRRRWACSA